MVKEKKRKGIDAIEIFEYSMSFDNIEIGGFVEIINEVEEKNEDGECLGYVLYEKFKTEISRVNTAWEDELMNKETVTSKILLSPEFCFTDNGMAMKDAINSKMLISFALLHCAYRDNDSAKVFTTIV